MKTSTIVIIALVVALIITQLTNFNIGKHNKQLVKLYETSQDSLKITKNSLGQEISKTTVLQAENSKLVLQIHTKDSSIIALQELLKKAKKENKDVNTALVISNETILHLQDSLHNLIIGYTHNPDTPSIVYPIYKRDITNEWWKATIIMGADTLDVHQKIVNKYEITVGTERKSLFTRSAYAEITNLNPNTETKTMKVFQKTPVKNDKLISFSKGVGVGIIAIPIVKLLIKIL